MLTGSTDRRTNLVDHTFCDARLNRHSLKRILAGRQHRNLEMQVRAAGPDRIVHKDDLLTGLHSLPTKYRFLPSSKGDTRHRHYRRGVHRDSVGHDGRKKELNNVDDHHALEKIDLAAIMPFFKSSPANAK